MPRMAKKGLAEPTMRSHMLPNAEGKKSLLGEAKVSFTTDMDGKGADDERPSCAKCGCT
jgi:hypothetical protein